MLATLGLIAGRLLRSRVFWYTVIALAIALVVYSYVWPYAQQHFGVAGRVLDRSGQAITDIDTALKEVDAKDRTIAALSRQIQREHEATVAAIARAAALQGQVEQSRIRADGLAQRVAQLEAQRRALQPVTTLQEAKRVLEDLGYHPSLIARP